MSIDTEAVYPLLKKLDDLRSQLSGLLAEYSAISTNAENATTTLSITVGKSTRDMHLTQMHRDYKSYREWVAPVPGTEMILLGVKKWYAAAIEKKKADIRVIESDIAKHTRGSA